MSFFDANVSLAIALKHRSGKLLSVFLLPFLPPWYETIWCMYVKLCVVAIILRSFHLYPIGKSFGVFSLLLSLSIYFSAVYIDHRDKQKNNDAVHVSYT